MVVPLELETTNEELASAFADAIAIDEASRQSEPAGSILRSLSILADDERRSAFFERESIDFWNPYLRTNASSAERRERALFLRYNSRRSVA